MCNLLGLGENGVPKVGSFTNRNTKTVVIMESEDEGVIQWVNGNKYSGQIRNQYPEGQGKIAFVNGNSYFGQWRNGVF